MFLIASKGALVLVYYELCKEGIESPDLDKGIRSLFYFISP